MPERRHIEALRRLVDDNAAITEPDRLQPYLSEWRGIARGRRTPLLLMPSCTEQVSRILRYCNEHRIAVVPQGGNTGLCGGAVPDDSNEQIIVNLSRMNRIREVSPDNFSMVAEAGCILADIQQVAYEHDRLFALSLAAEGSCEIGGNLSTNAGGINVIRYGNARDQVLGLEVVLANGDVIDGLRVLRKDTAGYDLKQLFVGSEGTLGVVTAAALKLYPRPESLTTAMLAIDAPADAVHLLSLLRARLRDGIEAFELLSPTALAFVARHKPDYRQPLPAGRWCVLLEASVDADSLELPLHASIEAGLVTDAVLAKNDAEREAFWQIRHAISEVQKHEGASLKHDIAVPIDRIPALLERAESMVRERVPGARLCVFGHVGDGNLHYNVSQPVAIDAEAFRASATAVTAALYDIVADLGGTFSAEHGVGSFKAAFLPGFRSEAEIGLMRTLKDALDPNGILNPGKVIC